MRFAISSKRAVCWLVFLACSLRGVQLLAQDRTAEESRREQWQKVQEIFAEMRIRPGATVADVGAGDGFFTSRLARAVGPDGRVFAVDIDEKALERLRKRLDDDGIRNVTIIKGAGDDPKLPADVLDSALIVNAYHEIEQHQSVLSALRRALKRDGRLVIVEPVRDSRRGRPRADQVRDHEIDPEFVLREARAAGFHIVDCRARSRCAKTTSSGCWRCNPRERRRRRFRRPTRLLRENRPIRRSEYQSKNSGNSHRLAQ
jgi:predicted methyltransferase